MIQLRGLTGSFTKSRHKAGREVFMESFIEQFLKKETVTGMIFDVDKVQICDVSVWIE